jgi:fibronectin-binding autotransporter adhesin
MQWAGVPSGNLNLFFNSDAGGTGGNQMLMTGAQTGNLTITNSAAVSKIFRVANAGSAGGSFTMQSGAGAFTLGGTGSPIQLQLTVGSSVKNITLTNNSTSLATFGSNVTWTAGTVGGAILVAGSGNIDILGNITGGGATGLSITKTNAGTLTLAGDNTGVNGITVSGGKLLVNNTTGSGTGIGAVTVGTNATLGGSGTIAGNTTVNGKLNSSGKLTFGAALTLTGTSETTFEIGSLTNYDVLANDGGDTVTFNNGATIVFDASGYTANRGDSFLVLSNWSSRVASGTINFTVTNLTSGYSLDTSKLISDGHVTVITTAKLGLYIIH